MKDNKMFYAISIVVAILIVVSTMWISYAYFVGSVSNSEISTTVIETAHMEVEFTDGPEVSLQNVLPGVYLEKTFSVRNIGTLPTSYDIFFSDFLNTFVDQSDLVYSLTSNDGGANVSETIVPAEGSKIVSAHPIALDETHTYTLRIEFKETNDNQDDNKGKKFKTVIRVNEFRVNDTIIGYLENKEYGVTGEYHDVLRVNNMEYPAHVYNYVGSQTWTTDNISSITNNATYNGFGNAEDVASGTAATAKAQQMVIIKVEGDLTIESGVTVRPYYTSYGGPKGFMIYATGTLTNKGVIDNSHGAYATGENVYLWQNAQYESEDTKFEFVPALGGTGGGTVTSGASKAAGIKGANGENRGTAGGGSGSVSCSTGKATSGAGSRGTSYSGGTGGGSSGRTATSGLTQGYKGSDEGGAGGRASGRSGGAGNPGGSGSPAGANGTGGLLIIYANAFDNQGSLTSNGAKGGAHTYSPGGCSGGGSINVFYNQLINRGTITSVGGTQSHGGAGGAGSITVGSVASGTFVHE